jgi:tetratricopeptide (TPR) repeat protein
MRLGPTFALLTVLAAAAAQLRNVHAQSTSARDEARERFDRGLKLFEEGDSAGALSEFKRAYELVASPVVLYNIGLVYEAMRRPVDAVDALDKVLANPSGLTADQLARATKVRDEQRRRIASVRLVTSAPGAVVDVDGILVGKTPLKSPVRFAGGTHVIAVTLTGFHPFRKEVTIAGGDAEDLAVELVPLEQSLARLEITTHLLDADVIVDGKPSGRTPLAGPIALSPGPHHVELRRDGYRTAKTDVTLSETATGEATLEPEPDPAALAREGEPVRLVISEDAASLSVDGGPLAAARSEITVLPGRHVFRIERAGFLAVERTVQVQKGVMSTVRIDMEPSPETRAEHQSRARTRRTWGWITVGAGAVITGAGVAYVFANKKAIDEAQTSYDQTVYDSQRGSGRRCDHLAAGTDFAQCDEELNSRYDSLTSQQSLTKIGYITAGIGGAVLVTGVVVLLTGEDSSRYESPRTGAWRSLVPIVSFERGRAFLGAHVSF